ncbi:hypothetical protein HDE68_000327 [Pedobacter cryoconitis]|uniref:Uncharacterized protein n=1 Tax=Pedobacter cryoconitis TaxID=188932 RepID=A0A7W8ZI66_9SPHI|nr:hypothetical protein [Pedobacter cryoconitis]MBB5634442.1 hypothetical protein [Pedobacter cryoconitis]
MAKKNLGDIEDNNKNLGGVSALFNSPSKDNGIKDGKQDILPDEEIVTYPLRLKKSSLKALKILGAQRGVTVKELIMSLVEKEYEV